MSFSRDIINALMPTGAAWEPETGGDYDNLLDGIAANSDAVLTTLRALREIRNPAATGSLSDLEAEYGIIPVPGATSAERRARLAAFMFRRSELPTYESLQNRLVAAGFVNAQVHVNSPAVDPAVFILRAFQMVCNDLLPGGNDPQCGEAEALCASLGGELLVNGDLFKTAPDYTILCDEPLAQCGETDATAGEFSSVSLTPVIYNVPAVAGYWPLIFFVGGAATRDPVTDEITDIETLAVPLSRRADFRRVILRYKPVHSWAALVVAYG